MAGREIGHDLRHHLEAYQEAVRRILVELIGTAEQVIEERVLARDVADKQCLGELTLVLEVIEEAILGDSDRCNQLVD